MGKCSIVYEAPNFLVGLNYLGLKISILDNMSFLKVKLSCSSFPPNLKLSLLQIKLDVSHFPRL